MQSYEIHDNGGRFFTVNDYAGNKTADVIDNETGRILYSINYVNIFIGIEPTEPKYNGNSVVIQLNEFRYMFVGWKILEFMLEKNDEIIEYISEVGNSNVPYPYIVGKKNIYLMIADVYFPKDCINSDDCNIDYYYIYYHGNKIDKSKIKKIDFTILTNRKW